MTETTSNATTRRRVPRILWVAVIAVAALLALILVVTQIDKWTCSPPDQVWVESPDHCVDLP